MSDIERAKDILLDTDLYCVGYSTSELRNACDLAISALEKQIELNDYLNTLRKNKKYQIYDILSEFALEVENE